MVVNTVVSGNYYSILGVGQINVLKLDITNRALSARPSLDTNTVLTVDTSTILYGNVLDNGSFSTST